MCQPDKVCHNNNCHPLCKEAPLVSVKDCLCHNTTCFMSKHVLCKESKCDRAPEFCNNHTVSKTGCTCDEYIACEPYQGCLNKTCIDTCPKSPHLATEGCLCYGHICNNSQVCHQKNCQDVTPACDKTNLYDTNCVCTEDVACLSPQIYLEGECTTKPECEAKPETAPDKGCICTKTTVCKAGETCDKDEGVCKKPSKCQDPREAKTWPSLKLKILETYPILTAVNYVTQYRESQGRQCTL